MAAAGPPTRRSGGRRRAESARWRPSVPTRREWPPRLPRRREWRASLPVGAKAAHARTHDLGRLQAPWRTPYTPGRHPSRRQTRRVATHPAPQTPGRRPPRRHARRVPPTRTIGGVRDEVDRLVEAWRRERADLDLRPMEVLSRVTRLGHHLDRARRQAFAEHAIESWEFDVLAALRRAGTPYELSPGRLLKETLVTSGTMTNRVDRLAARGLVERLPDPQRPARRAGAAHRRRAARRSTARSRGCWRGSRRCSPGSTRDEQRMLAGLLRALVVPFEGEARDRERRSGCASCPARTSTRSGSPAPRSSTPSSRWSPRTAAARRSSSRGCTWCPTTAAPATSTCCAGHVSTLGAHGVSGIKVVGDFVPELRARPAQRAGAGHALRPAHRRPARGHGRHPDHRGPHRRDDRGRAPATSPAPTRGCSATPAPAARRSANVTMLDELFDLDEIRVTSRRPESREAFAERLRAETDHARCGWSAPSTRRSTAPTSSSRRPGSPSPPPLLRTGLGQARRVRGALRHGQRGRARPARRDGQGRRRRLARGAVGPVRRAAPRTSTPGRLSRGPLHAELGEVVTGASPGRESPDERILLWHRGLSILDVAVPT